MDELLNVETLPEVETETPIEETTVETDADTAETGAEEATEAQESAVAEPETTDTAEETVVEPPAVRVKYNKQERAFSIDEAAPLVEMGLKYESFKPHYEKLKDLAAGSGKSVSEMIDYLSEQSDMVLRRQLEDKYGDDAELIDTLFAAKKAERETKIKAAREAEAARQAQDEKEDEDKLTQRLADDFRELMKELPDKFKSIKDVPQKVLDDAIKSKRSLFDAYLRYQRAENKKSEAVKSKQAEAAKASTGSLNTPSSNIKDDYAEVTRAVFGY